MFEEPGPLVSIIIRTKDRPKLLLGALSSVAIQTYRPIEVVLVNDGGCDLDIEEIRHILRSLTLQYVRLVENTGRAHAGNMGIENAKGKYIGFLDDDDELFPDHVSVLVNCLEGIDYRIAYTDAELVFREFDPETAALKETGRQPFGSKDYLFANLLIENYIPLMNVFFLKEELDTAGRFDEGFDVYEDWDLLIRCASRAPFFHIKKVTTKYVQWSRELQVAQSEMHRNRRARVFDSIVEKHRDKFSVDVLKYFAHFKTQAEDLRRAMAAQDDSIRHLEEILKTKNIVIAGLEETLTDKDQRISNLEVAIHEGRAAISQLEAGLEEKIKKIEILEGSLSEKSAALEKTDLVLQNIYGSTGWKFLLACWKISARIFPAGSKRRRGLKRTIDLFAGFLELLSVENLRTSVFYVRRYGLGAFIKRSTTKLTTRAESLFHRPKVPNIIFKKSGNEDERFFEDITVSVVIPTLNAGSDFEQLLSMLQLQRGIKAIEIIVVDSGSSDGTAETAQAKGAKVIPISPAEFSHSYARNLGARHAAGDYLLFTVQDALPPSFTWVRELLKAVKDNGVVAVSCAETPREDVDLLYRVLSWNHLRFLGIDKGDRILSRPEPETTESLRKNGQLSDVACLINREIFQKYEYRNDYAEDLDLGVRLIRDGYTLALLGSVSIIHSHNRPCSYYLKRWYAETIVLPKIIPGIPDVRVDYASLACDMVFTYHVLSKVLLPRLSEVNLPVRPADLASAVSNGFVSATALSFPENFDPGDDRFVDEAFRRLLGAITSTYAAGKCGGSYRGELLTSMLSFMEMTFRYLTAAYDLLYQDEVEEIKACLYKVFALHCGTSLAHCFRSGDDATKALLAPIDRELLTGI